MVSPMLMKQVKGVTKPFPANLPGMKQLKTQKKGGHLATIHQKQVGFCRDIGEVPHAYYLGGTDEKTEEFGNGSLMKPGTYKMVAESA